MAFWNTLKSFLGDGISVVVYLVIILLFVLGIMRCVMPVVRTRGLLNRAIRQLRSGKNAKAWQEDNFLGKGSLMPHWSEYLNNLFFADGEYHNAYNVEDYINEETVITGPGRAAFSEALPSIMVSLGFLGTLIGLSMSLSGFDASSDAAAIAQSTATLVSGMRFAFMTSIVGVIGSVSFTLITRMTNGSAQHALIRFYGAMSRYAGVLSVDPMTQIAIYQQEQTQLMQQMSRDLAAKELGETVYTAMDRAIRPLSSNMNNFMTFSTQEQMRFLDTVVNRFVEHMDISLNGRFQQLGQTIEETCRYQEKSAQSARDGSEAFSRLLREQTQLEQTTSTMLTKFEGYLTKLANAQSLADDSFQKLSGAAGALGDTARAQSEYIAKAGAFSAEITAALDGFRTSSEKYMNALSENTGAAGEDLAESARQIAQARGQLTQDMQESVGYVEKLLAGYLDSVKAATDNVYASVSRLPDAVSATSQTYIEQMNMLTETLNGAQAALDDAVRAMYRE